ncbi:MAG TPA: response regulator, partial [Thermodesulfovibrionales bacterium]|nr:response regulator [Thermodesulfovibrionales bacterium]
GIPEDHLARIFDPYFTTKDNGNGLGLATAYSIIKNHNGFITVESHAGAGTTFYIYLRASDREVAAPKEVERPIEGRGRVLVMDDEEMVRVVAGNILSKIGYTVEFAGDGAEAVRLYEKAMEEGDPFSIVILDLSVPEGMGGKEAVQRLTEIDPKVKAIVSSGYSNDSIMAEFRDYGFKGVVSKPYTIKEISEALYSVILEEINSSD